MQFALTENVRTLDELIALARTRATKPPRDPPNRDPDDVLGRRSHARRRRHRRANAASRSASATRYLVPQVIIYDPALGALTPEWLWLSSAHPRRRSLLRGLSRQERHAGLRGGPPARASRCSRPRSATRSKIPGDPFARLDSQMASYLACTNSSRAGSGASHGIGYILGGRYGVHHGHSSCVMLPHVLRWNEATTAERQKQLSVAIGRPHDERRRRRRRTRSPISACPPACATSASSEDQLPAIAEEAAKHPVVQSNPRPITGASRRSGNPARRVVSLVRRPPTSANSNAGRYLVVAHVERQRLMIGLQRRIVGTSRSRSRSAPMMHARAPRAPR